MSRGIQRGLADLLGESPAACYVGIVTAVETHAAWGHLLTVTLQPEGLEVQARPGHLSTGSAGGGVYVPFEVDAEVLVLLPGNDPNRAVALHGPASTSAPIPTGWNNDSVLVQHSGGLEVRGSNAGVMHAVVLETLLGDLANALTELAAGVTSGSPTPTPTTTALVAALATGYRSGKLTTE